MKKILLIGGGIIILIIVVAAIVGAGSTNEPEKVGEASEQKASNETADESKVYKVGDQVKLGNAIVTVNKVEFSNGGEFLKPAEGNEWIDLNITVENTGSSEQYLTTLGQMFIRDGAGNSYQIASTSKSTENINQMLDGTIIAKSKRTGWVGFEIKKGATGLQFQYNDSMWGSGKIIVDLGR